MTCFEFEQRLQDQLDLRHSELSAESEAHAAGCGTCRKLLEQFRRIDAVVAVWRNRLPVVDLTDSVLQDLQPDAAVAAKSRSSIPVTSSAYATKQPSARSVSASEIAAMFVSAIALLVMLGTGWNMSRKTLIVRQQSARRTETAVVQERQLDLLVQDARAAYAVLGTQALQHVSTASFLLPPAEAVSPFRGEDAVDGVPDSLSRPLSPLGHELRNAFDSLLDQVFTSQDSST
jgi:hypothetical protein